MFTAGCLLILQTLIGMKQPEVSVKIPHNICRYDALVELTVVAEKSRLGMQNSKLHVSGLNRETIKVVR